MSKLKEMKKTPREKKGFDLSYVFLGIAVLLVVAVIYFAMFGASQNRPVSGNIEDDDPFKGPADAKVSIVEFSDFQCPACGAFYPVLKQAFSEYSQRVKFVYRDFPLTSIHPFAEKAAEAAECADKQGRFWEYHDKLFENQSALETKDLKQYASGLGLDSQAFSSCLDSGEFSLEVSRDAADAQNLGARGTPTIFINNVMYSSMPYAQLKGIIDAELAKQ